MALALKSEMVLEKDQAAGYVLLRKVRSESGHCPEFRLHPYKAFILSLLDGERQREEIVAITEGVLGLERGGSEAAVDTVLTRYRQFLTDVRRQPPDGARYSPSDFLFRTEYDFALIREPAPVALLWVVTEYCNRKCRYCYKDPFFAPDEQAPDLGLPLARLREIAREAAEIGVTQLTLTGGEPFLRPDLPDVIESFARENIVITPITKMRITGERMRRLKMAGLGELHVSLDSHRPDTVDYLTDVPGTFSDLVDTLRAAQEYDLHAVVRGVVTSRNLDDMEELVDFVYGLGVRELILDLYQESCGRHDPAFEIAPEDRFRLEERHAALCSRYPDVVIHLKFDEEDDRRAARGAKGCVEGAKGLTILPDGRVTKCEHWRYGDEMIFGDLRHQSIMEVWNSDLLREINWPSRERFSGTPCARCKEFDGCNNHRGRCSLTALQKFGSIYAPDIHCPTHAYQKTRVGAKSRLTVLN